MLSCIGANVSGVLEDDKRPTITKTRVMARSQQVVRIDRESKPTQPGASTGATGCSTSV